MKNGGLFLLSASALYTVALLSYPMAADAEINYPTPDSIDARYVAQGDLKSTSQLKMEPTVYRPRASLGPFYQTHTDVFGLYDLFLPYTIDSKTIVFADGRYYERGGNSWEYNAGLGLREITPDGKLLWTVYGFYDDRGTRFGNTFNQLTFGADFQTQKWYFNTNAYVPVGKRQAFVSQFNTAFLCSNNTRICYARGIERSMGGWDAETGYDIWRGLRGYVGMYVFSAKRVTTAIGPNLRLEYNIRNKFGKIVLITNWRDDALSGSVWYAGARLDVTLGKLPPNVGLERKMTSFIRRDLNVEMSSDGNGSNAASTESVRVLRNDFDAQETQVALVNTAAGLTLASITPRDNIIGVQGTITTAAATNLNTNQILEGGVFRFMAEGQQFQVQVGQNGGMSRGGATGFPLITVGTAATVGQNVTIENMSFNSTGALSNLTDYIVNHTASAFTIGNFVFRSNRSTTAGNLVSIDLGVTNISETGSVLVQGNSFTGTGTAGTSDFIRLINGGLGSRVNVIVDGNTFLSTVNVGILSARTLSNGILNLTITNNVLTNAAIDAGAGNGGPTVEIIGGSTPSNSLNVTEITNNTLTNTLGGVSGTNALLFTNSVTVGSITGNVLSGNGLGGGGVGTLRVNTLSTGNFVVTGPVSGNTFTATDALGIAFNVSVTGLGGSATFSGGIFNNTFTSTGTDFNTFTFTSVTVPPVGLGTITMVGFYNNTFTPGFTAGSAIVTNLGGTGFNNFFVGNGFAGTVFNLAAANGIFPADVTSAGTTNIR